LARIGVGDDELVVIDESHAERALAPDLALGQDGLPGVLQQAASAFVDEAVRRREADQELLALEHCYAGSRPAGGLPSTGFVL